MFVASEVSASKILFEMLLFFRFAYGMPIVRHRVVQVDDPHAKLDKKHLDDVLSKQKQDEIIDWFRYYKTAEGPAGAQSCIV